MAKRTKLLSIVSLLLIGLMMMPMNTFATQKTDYEQIPLSLEGKEIISGEALLIDSITYVPLRRLSESAKNCTIKYDDRTKTATVK